MRAVAAAACLLLVGAPLAAQEAYEPAFTPEDDLDCALYVAALMAETEVEMTPESRTGLTSAFTYFIGRYEAQRGLDTGAAFAERYTVFSERNSAEIAQTCSIRMRSFGNRLQNARGELSEVQAATPIDPATGSAK